MRADNLRIGEVSSNVEILEDMNKLICDENSKLLKYCSNARQV
jgi:hypothetical protein